jgi:hypothetical protein
MAIEQAETSSAEDGDLKELERMAANLEREENAPNEEEQAQAEKETVNAEMQAYGVARMACEMAARGASMRWECLSYTDKVKDEGAQVLVPVFLKYGLQNEFMSKWAEEFAAGAFFAGVIFTSYQKVQAEKAKKEAEKEAEHA